MKTYKNVITSLVTLLKDAVNLAEPNDTLTEKLGHIEVRSIVNLAKEAKPFSDLVLANRHAALTVLSDETGERRRDILSLPTAEFQKGSYSANYKDLLSTFCTKSSCSFMFLISGNKFIHCHFIIDNETNVVDRVSFNETIYKADDPMMIGGIHLLNDLDRGLAILEEYE